MEYQMQFTEGATAEEIIASKNAANELIIKFTPLFKKYLALIKTGQIDFDDKEMKRFVLSFIGDTKLKKALKSEHQTAEMRHPILQRFNFVKETYGNLTEEEITIDLQMLFLTLAKRYKQMGRNFCAYLYNAFCYEVSRHIKKFTKNPGNIHYKSTEYEDYMQSCVDVAVEECFEDKIYENNVGIPDMTWISGQNCSDLFAGLEPFDRKLLIKYYMEDYNDRQIAEEFGMHINTCNQKRRQAVIKLAKILGIKESDIKRNRKSGKKALFRH
jgi:hypothetical protein